MQTEINITDTSGIVRVKEERGEIGRLEFDIHDGIVTINHTYTYQGFEGRGVGKQLVETTVKWAEQNGYKILPICSFAKVYMERHPEYRHLEATTNRNDQNSHQKRGGNQKI